MTTDLVKSESGSTFDDFIYCLVVFFTAQEAELNQDFTTTGYKTDFLHSCDFFFPRPYTGFPPYTRDKLHTAHWWERVKSRVETLKPLSA